MFITRKPVQKRGIGEKWFFFPLLAGPLQRVKSIYFLYIFILHFSFQEVEKFYTRIISQKSIDETLKTTILERLKNVREKRKSLPLKKSSKVNKKVQL